MPKFDRLILIVLAVGVWALVLKPTSITAHSSNEHECSISGQAFGDASGRDHAIYLWSGVTVECSHF